MYTIQQKAKEIAVTDYIKEYVDVEKFQGFCRDCRNYRRHWGCPPHDFDVLDYWRQFQRFHVVGIQILFDAESRSRFYSQEEFDRLYHDCLLVESDRLMVDLTALEAQAPGSRVVYPGRCHLCGLGQCSRALQQPCLHPEQLRYSIESLGGDVGKTTEQLLGYGLQWLRQGQLPEYLSLVGGVLYR